MKMKLYQYPYFPMVGVFVYSWITAGVCVLDRTDNYLAIIGAVMIGVMYYAGSIATAHSLAGYYLERYVQNAFKGTTSRVDNIRAAYTVAMDKFATPDAIHIVIYRTIQFLTFAALISAPAIFKIDVSSDASISALSTSIGVAVMIYEVAIYGRIRRSFRPELAECVSEILSKEFDEVQPMTAVRLDSEFVQIAQLHAKENSLSTPNQIMYWARIGKAAEENPDLSLRFINDVMEAERQAAAGEMKPYVRRT